MYSALYYPHTSIRSEGLLRTALLLWDEVHFIVPWDGFKHEYASPIAQEAVELIGRRRVPTSAEQKAAHELIEDFATRDLPRAFQYIDGSQEPYELYPQKFMNETWEILRQAKLAGATLPNTDVPTTRSTGLSLMSILADCCAGDNLARVTDQDAAYAALSGALVEDDGRPQVESARHELMSIPLKVAALDNIPLKKLVEFRKREAAGGESAGLTQLRHRLVDSVSEQAASFGSARTEADHTELKRLFEQKLTADLRDLREALKLETTKVLGSKEIIASIIGAAGVLWPLFAVPPVAALTATGAAIAIGGLLATRAKFAQTRSKVLEKHPMAYLYEASGGTVRL